MMRNSDPVQFFYQAGKLVTVRQSDQYRALLRHAEIPLAELHVSDTGETGPLATHDKDAVPAVQQGGEKDAHAFLVHGHDPSLVLRRSTLG